jgi:hypothetical protein|tara:strand:+ start:343 stop:657 length:315 start_codon:yes stop_codon:yes gene_type:complete
MGYDVLHTLGTYRGFKINEIDDMGTIMVSRKKKEIMLQDNGLLPPMSMIRTFIDHLKDDDPKDGVDYTLNCQFIKSDIKELLLRAERLNRHNAMIEWGAALGLL